MKKADDEEVHIHHWVEVPQFAEKRCNCGKRLIGEKEYNRRVEEYRQYYLAVGQSDSYKRFLHMKKAFNEHNLTKVRAIMVQVGKALEKDEWLEKPAFPDPDNNPIYEVIKEGYELFYE